MDAAVKPVESRGAKTGTIAVVDSTALYGRRYQPLVLVALAAMAGIICDRYGLRSIFAGVDSAIDISWFVIWWCLCATCLALWWFVRNRQYDGPAGCLLLVSVALTGAAWHNLNWFLFDRNEVARYAAFEPAPVCIEAIARESPERVSAPRPTPLRAIPVGETSRLRVALTGIRDAGEWRPASGTCQLSVEGHLLGIHQGDQLLAFGRLALISPPLNPGETDFAARARTERELVRVRSSAPECVSILSSGGGFTPSHFLDSVRVRAKQVVRSLVGPDRAGLAAAILLGAREGLPYEETETYMLTGTIHVLVVSGLHVAILALGLWGILRMGWLPRRAGLCLIIVVVIAYALLAEVHPSIVRAATLCVLVCLAEWAGRHGVAFNSLFAAALVVLAMNPADMFQTGLQLSFLAVASLIWSGWGLQSRKREARDPLEVLLAAGRPWYRRALSSIGRWTGWLMVTSGIVWLMTLPLVLNAFHVASPIAIVVSPAIWLLVILAMWSGLTMLAIAPFTTSLGAFCGSICSASLGGLETVVRWAESVPIGHFFLPGPAWWWVAVFYVAMLYVMIWGNRLLPLRWQLATLALWILVGLVPFMTRGWTHNGLECTVVAVGHGECIALEAPGGATMLYDAGGIGSPEYATQSIADFLWNQGIVRIDGIVLSHADTDHYNAVPGLLERFSVGAIYVSPLMFRSAEYGGPKALHDAIVRAGVPIRKIWSGDQLHVGPDVTIQVLHPPRKGVLGTDNANSVTLGVEYAGRRILLPGDLESPGIDDVMAELPYHCDVLLAPHHGSRRSDPPGFAAWSTPNWVVLSGGGGELVEPVIRTYEHEGARVLVTSEVGAVHFRVLPDSTLTMTTWRPPAPTVATLSSRP